MSVFGAMAATGRYSAVLLVVSVLCSCSESDAPSASPGSEDTGVRDDVLPSPDTEPAEVCGAQSPGSSCEDGDPCTLGDVCSEQGQCVSGAPMVCTSHGTKPCVDVSCQPDESEPTLGICVEVPLVAGAVEDGCYRYECADGEATDTSPVAANDCADWVAPEGGCVDHYVCDPDAGASGTDGLCRPAFKPDGAGCWAQGAGVKAASSAASPDEASTCLLYVCKREEDPDTALSSAQCVLSSTLPEEEQNSLAAAGAVLRHECAWDEVPSSVALDCNEWRCGCQDESCAAAECQVFPIESTLSQPCDNGNFCDESVCLPGKGSDAVMTCEATVAGGNPCDVFPNATCDVSDSCDAQTGCAGTMNVAASDANCQINNACMDAFNTRCAPNDPNADPETGCVVVYQEAGVSCIEGLQDNCVVSASCQPYESGMKCQVTEWVDCEDGNPCTQDYCSEGLCLKSDLPGGCDDQNPCTTGDTCTDGVCIGQSLGCDNGQFCDGPESCDENGGCGEGSPPVLSDGLVCTLDSCDEVNDVVVHTPITACDDTDGCCAAGCNANDDVDCSAICGNNVSEPGEGCDDGGTEAGDGCSATCTVEEPSGDCGDSNVGVLVDSLWWQKHEISAGASCLGMYYTHAQALQACTSMGPGWSLPTIAQANALLAQLSSADKATWFPLGGNGGTTCSQMQEGGNGVWWLADHNGQSGGAAIFANSSSVYTTGTSMGEMYLYRARCVHTGCPGEPTCAEGAEPVAALNVLASKVSGTLEMTLNQPPGTVSGDVLIAAITTNNKTFVTPPAGWTKVQGFGAGGNCGSDTFSHVVASGESGSYTFAFASSTHASALIAGYRHVDPSQPIHAVSGAVTGDYTAPGLTTTTNNALLAFVVSSGNGMNTWSTPSGWTVAHAGQQNATSTGLYHRSWPIAGPVPAVTAPATLVDVGHAHLLALQPACP